MTVAPPLDGKLVMQESTYPIFGAVERYPSPSGTAAGLTGPLDVTVVA
jgi:hypothetical protein